MTDHPDNLEPWQRVAREMNSAYLAGMEWVLAEPACREIARLRAELASWRELAMPDEPSDEAIGRLNSTHSDYEAAATELERWRPSQTDLHGECRALVNELHDLRAVLELVAGSLLAAQQKRGDAPCSADAHIDEAVAAVREFVPGEEYSQEAKALRMTLWASDQDRLDSQQTMEIAQLRAEVKRMRQLLGDA
jgi:hypothetical protein